MSNNNERIAQISALTLNYEKIISTDRNVSQYNVDNMLKSINSTAAIINKENEISLAEIVRAEEFHKAEEAKRVDDEHDTTG